MAEGNDARPLEPLRMLREAVEASGEIVFLTDVSGVFTYVNPEFTRVYGYAADEVVGRHTPRILKSGLQSPEFYSHFWDELREGRPLRTTYVNRAKDGRLVTVEASASAVLENGQIVGYMALQRDVTAQRQADLAAELAHFALDHAPDAVFWFDASGRVLYANQMAVQASGYSREELCSLTIGDLEASHSATDYAKRWTQLLATGSVDLETTQRRKDGTVVPVEIRVNKVEFPHAVYGCALVRDLTDRKELEQQFLQAQKMEAVGRLAGGIAHDFNNLLTVILGYGQLLLDQIADPGIRNDIQEILNAGDRASALTHQLLAFSRTQVLTPENVNLNEAIEQIRKMLGRLIGEDIALSVELEPDLWLTQMDRGQFEQVLVNLIVNARDAMPKGGPLTIRTGNVSAVDGAATRAGAQAGDYVSVAVEDSGTGIAPELLGRVMDPFFTTKPVGKGTGLGLSTVYGIARQSGGFVTLRSEVGRGTTVTVYLPRGHGVATSNRPVESTAREPGNHDETILVVEDEPSVRNVVTTFLKQSGYTVLVAPDVAVAIAIARDYAGPIHLLLTDIVMPDLNGPDLAQILLGCRPDLGVLLMSGYANTLPAGGPSGVGIVKKPFTANELLGHVRQALDRRPPTAPPNQASSRSS